MKKKNHTNKNAIQRKHLFSKKFRKGAKKFCKKHRKAFKFIEFLTAIALIVEILDNITSNPILMGWIMAVVNYIATIF